MCPKYTTKVSILGLFYFFFNTLYHDLQLVTFFPNIPNENLNGLIRNYYPKKTNFEPLTKTDVEFVEHQLNNRPRKRLGFLTPSNVINFLTQKVAFKT